MTQTEQFESRDLRDARYEELRAGGKHHLMRWTTHLDNKPAIVWCLSRSERSS